ncbi:unnamed protein product [Caenorhabditis brenneri]
MKGETIGGLDGRNVRLIPHTKLEDRRHLYDNAIGSQRRANHQEFIATATSDDIRKGENEYKQSREPNETIFHRILNSKPHLNERINRPIRSDYSYWRTSGCPSVSGVNVGGDWLIQQTTEVVYADSKNRI